MSARAPVIHDVIRVFDGAQGEMRASCSCGWSHRLAMAPAGRGIAAAMCRQTAVIAAHVRDFARDANAVRVKAVAR